MNTHYSPQHTRELGTPYGDAEQAALSHSKFLTMSLRRAEDDVASSPNPNGVCRAFFLTFQTGNTLFGGMVEYPGHTLAR